MQTPKTLSEFFAHAVNVMFAVVIGISFQVSGSAIIPVEKIGDNIVSFAIIILGYGIVVSGWVGYFLSIKENRHKGKLGAFRFFLDVITLFLFYYIVSLAKPENIPYQKDLFILLPILYGVYLGWDIAKYYEHRKRNQTKQERKDRIHRIRITGDYLLWFVVLAIIYNEFLPYDENLESINLIFITVSGVLVILYRIAKYLDIRGQKTKTRTVRKQRSKNPD